MQLYYNAVPGFIVKYMAVTLKETTWENHIPINKKNELKSQKSNAEQQSNCQDAAVCSGPSFSLAVA